VIFEIVNVQSPSVTRCWKTLLLCVAVGGSAIWLTLPRIALAAAVGVGYRSGDMQVEDHG